EGLRQGPGAGRLRGPPPDRRAAHRRPTRRDAPRGRPPRRPGDADLRGRDAALGELLTGHVPGLRGLNAVAALRGLNAVAGLRGLNAVAGLPVDLLGHGLLAGWLRERWLLALEHGLEPAVVGARPAA